MVPRWYLKHVAHQQTSWGGDQISANLPLPAKIVTQTTPYRYLPNNIGKYHKEFKFVPQGNWGGFQRPIVLDPAIAGRTRFTQSQQRQISGSTQDL